MTDKQKYNWRAFCNESIDQIENYKQAEADDFKGWCIHHRLEIQPDGTRVSMQELKDKNLYYGRPASELVFMKVGEHMTLHWIGNTFNKGKHPSVESRQKMSEARKGENHPFFGKHFSEEHRQKIAAAKRGDNNPNFGKHLSEETRKKLSEALKGKHPSAEARQKMSEANKGNHNVKGKLWWNNGISNTRSKECPGEGWTRGRLRFK